MPFSGCNHVLSRLQSFYLSMQDTVEGGSPWIPDVLLWTLSLRTYLYQMSQMPNEIAEGAC